ncbi:MAG: glucose-6-phosphate isomerase [Pseudomonadota bacterium]
MMSTEKTLRLDLNNVMADAVGTEHGFTPSEIGKMLPRLEEIGRDLDRREEEGDLAFRRLPGQTEIQAIGQMGRRLRAACDDFVVLGMGGSALGGIALLNALGHPLQNLLPREKRRAPRVFFADNVDPEGFEGLLQVVDPRNCCFNVISKSGGTAETLAQFLVVRHKLNRALGASGARERIIVTTDPQKGFLREMADKEGYQSLDVPPGVGGRHSWLTAVGLLPAAVAGIDIEALMAGAGAMNERCRKTSGWQNPAQMGALIPYLAHTSKGLNIYVMMPYADALYRVADWFRQMWAESLGKRLSTTGEVVHAGQTPLAALGATDQHSQLQLYMEGPFDKLVGFITVDRYRREVKIPAHGRKHPATAYLTGKGLSTLIQSEQRATETALTMAGRPNLSFRLPEVTPEIVGQLLFLLQLQTVYAGGLYGVNPLDQPGVELGKQLTYALMGREGYESKQRELSEKAGRAKAEYVI